MYNGTCTSDCILSVVYMYVPVHICNVIQTVPVHLLG